MALESTDSILPEGGCDESGAYFERIKPRLQRRIGRELRLARRVIDLGCGSCDLVRYLSAAYRQDVTGVDASDGDFPARRNAPQGRPFHCRRYDAARLGFAADESFDAAVSMWAFHEMSRPREVLGEIRRVLRPGGEVLIVDFPRGGLAQRLWHEPYYTPAEVEERLVEAGFHGVRTRCIEHGEVLWARGYKRPHASSE